jgi:1-acyl-sn-glycerol-3-phosphate acyltransferase
VPDEAPTVQLRHHLPAVQDDLREQMSGLEPDRRITDWGRSERIESIADRLVYDFLYRYWFRVEIEGIENVPSEGGVLLLANHAGAIPPDGAMIAKAIKEEHTLPRPVHLMSARPLTGVPGLGMLQTKLGRVAPHPANLQRLLFDEAQIVLAFPEGAAGSAKPVKERYRLRPFTSRGLIEAALEARATLVPVAVLGAEEAAPVIARLRLPALPRLPLSVPLPLPAKVKIRFLEPIDTAELVSASERDSGLAGRILDDVRALIQENLLELVADRRSPWLG